MKRASFSLLPVLVLVSAVFSGCVGNTQRDDLPIGEQVWDPLEPLNREVFDMNLALVDAVFDEQDAPEEHPPAASASVGKVITILPAQAAAEVSAPPMVLAASVPPPAADELSMLEFVVTLVGNVARYLETPIYLVNSVLQGDDKAISDNLGYLLINGALGFGLADIASELGVHNHPRDFGQTLGVWGVPSGAYLMVPFTGPTSTRNVAGLAVDGLGNSYLAREGLELPWYVGIGLGLADRLGPPLIPNPNQPPSTSVKDLLDSVRATSPDPYITVRDAFFQQERARTQSEDQMLDALPDIDDLLEEDFADDEFEF